MHNHARNTYVEAQIRTATPQRLRLMLIDGAIRFANQTVHHWEQEDNESAYNSLTRCRDIVSELLTSIRPEGDRVAQQVTAIYLFIYKTLTEAQLRREPDKMRDVVRVLEIERETWQQVCEAMPEAPYRDADEEITTGSTSISPPDLSSGLGADGAAGGRLGGESSSGGFSLEA